MRWMELYPLAYGRLDGIRERRMRIEALEAEAGALENTAKRLSSRERGGVRSFVRSEGLLTAAADTRAQLRTLVKETDELARQTDRQLMRLERPMDRLVLKLRFLTDLEPADIQSRLGLASSGYYRMIERGMAAYDGILRREAEANEV